MLKNIFLLCTLVAAATCSSQLDIIHTPSSITFKDAGPIPSDAVGKIVCSALGLPVTEPTQWNGMYITNAFGTPTGVLAVEIENSAPSTYDVLKPKSYPISGSDAHESLALAGEHVQESRAQYVTLDMSDGPSTFASYKNIFGEVNDKPKKISTSLKSDNPEHKKFLDQLSLLDKLTEILPTVKTLPQFITVHFTPLAGNSEAKKLLDDAIERFAEAGKKAYTADNVLILSTTSISSRAKRAVAEKQNNGDQIPDDLNLAKTYSEDYPVIFNIILWFGVVLAFSLLAISYAIASMDPGRDSIIYRMTSNRIKKDN